MKTEIGGTFKWSEEQIKAYAAAFREGDAVKVSGEWRKVKKYEGDGIQSDNFHATLNNYDTPVEYNPYCLNYDHDGKGNFAGVTNGFLESRVESPYGIVTPKDYEVQEGDKLVWLGEGYSHWVFGRSYTVEADSCGRLVAFDEDGLERLPKSENWAVIPRYENVKEEKEMNGNGECVGKFKKGDRVKVTGGGYKGCEGAVTQSDGLNGKPSYAVLLDDGCGGRWFAEEFLESIEEEEKSPEQEAFDYLLSQSKDETRKMLEKEVAIWAEVYLAHKKHDDLRRVIDILEKLEKGE